MERKWKQLAGDSTGSDLSTQKNGGGSVDLKVGESSQSIRVNYRSKKKKKKCLVNGCSNDMSICRPYYQRHRVCVEHSKQPAVWVNGICQRFCQQCSRFQSLEEFDNLKKSCQRRLEGHNRRRRKPRPTDQSLHLHRYLKDDLGPNLLQSGSPAVTFVSPPARGTNGGKLTRPYAGYGKEAVPRPFYGATASSSSSGGRGSHMFSYDESRALYLLPSFQPQSSHCRMVQSQSSSSMTTPIPVQPQPQPPLPILRADVQFDKASGSILGLEDANTSSLPCNGMTENVGSMTFPFFLG